MDNMNNICLCGCGQLTYVDNKGRPNKYVVGHKGNSRISSYETPIKKRCNFCKKLLNIENFSFRNLKTLNGRSYKRPRSRCKKCESAIVCTYQSRPGVRKHRNEQRKNDKTVKRWIQERISAWRKKTLNSDLTTEYLLKVYEGQSGRCYYTNALLEVFKDEEWRLRYQQSISIDRLDPDKGYMQGNVAFCLYVVNTMKGTLTEKQFYDRMKHILMNRGI
jgi:hypothetical protein